MPEGPEVTFMVMRLRTLLTGASITAFDFKDTGRYRSKLPNNYTELTFPLLVTAVDNKGKFIYFHLRDAAHHEIVMFQSLGMSGGWYLSPPHKSISFTLHYISADKLPVTESILYFMDQRRFATLKFITTNIAAELRKKLKSIGPDLINFFNSAPSAATLTEFTQQFITIARRNNFKNICVFLMDQSKFSGLGNYLKCEILNHAAIHPSSTISQLSDAQLHTLFTSIKYIVESNTTQSSAKLAEYSDMMVPTEDIYQFVVYKRTTAADDSGIAIIKLKTPDKRTTYFKSSLEVQPPLVN